MDIILGRPVRLTASLFFLSALVLSGCGAGPKQSIGGVAGGVAGALLGSQFGKGKGKLVGVALGTMLGAAAGSSIGQYMDEQDRQMAGMAAQSAFSSGQTASWTNPNNGNRGQITPVGNTFKANGRYCREFTHTAYIGGKPVEVHGTAAMMPDGSWEAVQ
ncbi:RT0821/Lpp0805 family surface protein [Candidatus Hydrogenosomobacter endosymbioticus]|uniref:17 kDa surface antigen n=1 Tax=Candidatus Hydrogenosomobacter endosymbioticus TaxID=2558174 RepID=A0ABM7V966_9PROT|nr:RT0821/Lpp0805 family surface protein [Candidatus Hydrogenosomobacter endosymbioticus]BDB96327.1 17 kDa surface antigen [Candidatus Hydrogenosomobacter endosymbioticus]